MRGDNWSFGIHVEGHPPDEQVGASFNRIGPHYFESLLRGRTIGVEDTPSSRQVAVVLRGALLQLGIGLAIGIPAALVGGRLLANQLYGVKGHDPLVRDMEVLNWSKCRPGAGIRA